MEKYRNIWKIAIPGAAIVLLLAVLAWRWMASSHKGSQATGASRTLAVVEIENLSDDHSLDWLGNGVVELLTSDLAQSKSLGVISTERIRGLVRQRMKGEGRLPLLATTRPVSSFHWIVSSRLYTRGAGNR